MKNLLLICLLLSFGSASAALNRWVDAQGNVHYSDSKPPANVKSKTLRSTSHSDDMNTDETEESNSSESSGGALKSIAERQAERKRAKLENQEAADKIAKEKDNAESIKSYCKAARVDLRSLKSGMRLAEFDENGERSFISDEQRQKNIAKVQRKIKEHCN